MIDPDIQKQIKAKERRNNIIVIALSVILVTVAVLYFFKDREHREIVNELRSEKDSIQVELIDLVIRYDSLATENDTINEQLFVAQAKVRNLLLEVEQTKRVSLEQINSYQKQVTTLRGIMRDFVVQIDSLNRRNQELMAENLEVREQFRQVDLEKQQLAVEKTAVGKKPSAGSSPSGA
jgi:predicted  nucleic acid-binding Zn-ribbon protein